MAAPLNNYLFGDHFKALHGMSVDEALSGKVAKINSTLMSAEEFDDTWKGTRIGKGMRPFAESHADMMQPTDVGATVRSWQRGPSNILVGDSHRVAAVIRDLTHAVRTTSRANDAPLYRGAHRSPSADVGVAKDNALSFTSDRHAAVSFTVYQKHGLRISGHRGAIFKAAPGLVRGVPLDELGGRPMTVGKNRRPEAEWLVDPQSVPTEWPKK
jgi:hypothetical protein